MIGTRRDEDSIDAPRRAQPSGQQHVPEMRRIERTTEHAEHRSRLHAAHDRTRVNGAKPLGLRDSVLRCDARVDTGATRGQRTETFAPARGRGTKVAMLAAVRPIPAPVWMTSSPPRVAITTRELALASPPTLDRRGGPRRAAGTTTDVDRFTAATHRPLPLWFALGYAGHWALTAGISISPHGILLRALDPSEASLELPQRDVMAAWRRLGTQLDARVGTGASPLWFSTACIGARDLIATLAERVAQTEIAVDVVPLDLRSGLRDAHMSGVLAPLADPAPHVLGVVLDEHARRRLEAIVAVGPRVVESGTPHPRPPSPPRAGAPEPTPPTEGRAEAASKKRRPPRRR
jgi:hypothetical protein